jgi:hypothetical protein
MNTEAALTSLEAAEFRAIDALGRLASGDPRRARLRDALDAARTAKAAFLRRHPDVLRKSARTRGVSLPTPPEAAVRFAREERDRMAEERRLGKRAKGTRRYQAPLAFCGQNLKLVDGSMLRVPEDGQVEIDVADHPAGGESAVHHQLVSMHFVPQPDKADAEMDAIKSALARPLVGDVALIEFLNRNAMRD